jgi:hypothetical protein
VAAGPCNAGPRDVNNGHVFDLDYDGDDHVVCGMCRCGMDELTFVLMGGRLVGARHSR